MLIPTIVMGVLATVLLCIGYFKGQQQHITGTKTALNMSVQILPLLVFALLVAGMIQALLPQELISKWVGGESGMRGIFIGTMAGALTPGGPFVCFPIIAGLLRAGASIGTTVAFSTAWALLSLNRIPMEVGIIGWKFTLIRLASSFFIPPIAGILAQTFFSLNKI